MTITEKRNLAKWKKQRLKPKPKLPPPFRWTPEKEHAAVLLATEENITKEQVGEQVGVTGRAVGFWIATPEFKARIEQHFSAWKDKIRAKGIALKERRIDAYLAKYDRLQQIVADRATEYAETGLGGKSGYVVKEMKTVAGKAEPHFVFDRALMAEERELMKQLAIELGQFEQQVNVTGADGGPIEISLSGPDGNPIRALGPELLMDMLSMLRSRASQADQKTIDVASEPKAIEESQK